MTIVPLLALAYLYAWYENLYFPEGRPLRFVVVGAIAFVGGTVGILWDQQRRRSR